MPALRKAGFVLLKQGLTHILPENPCCRGGYGCWTKLPIGHYVNGLLLTSVSYMTSHAVLIFHCFKSHHGYRSSTVIHQLCDLGFFSPM